MLKKFIIKKLYKTTDVVLNIKNGVNILIGENGIGKTTILNLLHAFITTDIKKMCDVKYEKVIIEVSSHQYTFTSESISNILAIFANDDHYLARRKPANNKNVIDNIIKIMSKRTDEDIKKYLKSSPRTFREYIYKAETNNSSYEDFSIYDFDALRALFFSGSYKTLRKLIELKKNIDFEVLYFPTFRRIETDSKEFGFTEDDAERFLKNTQLRFGMNDVTIMLENKLNSIEKSIKISFSKMTTDLLEQYVSNNKYKTKKINILNLDTIFSILSESLPQKLKKQIFDMIEDDSIYNDSNLILLNYINSLVDIYEEQSKNVGNIEDFVSVCNKYLYNKKMEFIKNELKVNIKSNDDENASIVFSNLSSGEKQMISIFSKLYLDNDKDYFILFDEPELSLSIEWQRMLIPDIMKTKCCRQLLAVTHSPFIFDNDYDKNTRSLQDCLIR